MRFRKIIASFFLYFAGITLLAHTVIPHYHDGNTYTIVFHNFTKKACSNNNTKNLLCNNNCDTSNCEIPDEDCHGSSKNCTDASIVIKIDEDVREELTAATNELILLFLIFSDSINSVAQIERSNSDFYESFAPPSYTDYIPDSQGLRAPPIC